MQQLPFFWTPWDISVPDLLAGTAKKTGEDSMNNN